MFSAGGKRCVNGYATDAIHMGYSTGLELQRYEFVSTRATLVLQPLQERLAFDVQATSGHLISRVPI